MSYTKIGVCLFLLLAATALVRASESDELREKGRALQMEAAELARAGYPAKAESVEREAQELFEKAEWLDDHRDDDDRHQDDEEHDAKVHELSELLENLRHEERELAEAGERKAAEEKRIEAESVENELHELTRGEHEDEHEHGPYEAIEHMHAAVEHLQAAGLHEIAEHVAERAEEAEHDLAERENHHYNDDLMHEVLSQLKEMREELGQLRRQVEELKDE